MRAILLCCCCLLAAPFLFAQGETYHRATLTFDSDEQRHALERAGVALDHGHGKRGTFTSDFSSAELRLVAAAGVKYRIDIEYVDQFYQDRNTPGHPLYAEAASKGANCGTTVDRFAGIETPANYHGGSMGGYLTYAELLAELDEMYAYDQANGLGIMKPRADNVNPADSTDLLTHDGHYQQWVKISDDPLTEDDTEPGVLYTALHHAREPHSMQQLVFFLWYLLENYTDDAEVRDIVDNTELYFIPCLNPDGYLYNEQTNPNGGGLWRKNRRPNGDGTFGVDLNRNYDYITPAGNSVFGTLGTSPQTSSDVYPGTAPFSEPETRANRYFLEHYDLSVALNNHTSGELLLYPFGYDYNKFTEDHLYFELLSEAMVRDNGYNNIISAGLYPASGDSDDFFYGYPETAAGGTRGKIFAMTPEIGQNFWPPVSQQEDISRGMVTLNLTAAAATGVYGTATAALSLEKTGEDYLLDYTLTRTGLVDGPLSVRLEAVSDNVEVIGETPGSVLLPLTGSADGQFRLRQTEGARGGEEVLLDLIVGNGRIERRQRLRRRLGRSQTVFTEDGEHTDAWTSDGWEPSFNHFAPGSPASSLTDSRRGSYASLTNTSLTLREPLDLRQTRTDGSTVVEATLTFAARWVIERDYDQAQVQVSTNNGRSWTSLCGQFTRLGTDTHLTPGEPVYDGRQRAWVREAIDLSEYIGEQVLLRFNLRSDESAQEDGFYVDDLAVEITTDAAVSTRLPLSERLTVSPNPFTDRITIGGELTDYDYQLTDASGKVLRSATGLRGTQTVTVGDLPAGLYLLTVRSARGERSLKLVSAKNR